MHTSYDQKVHDIIFAHCRAINITYNARLWKTYRKVWPHTYISFVHNIKENPTFLKEL